MTWRRSKLLSFAAFVLPAVMLILMASGIPLVMNFLYAVTNWNGISKTISYVGLGNFVELFTDDEGIRQATLFTMKFAILHVLITNVLAMLLAVLLDRGLRGSNLLRAVFFLPNILSLVVVGFLWKFTFTRVFGALFDYTGWAVFGLSWLGQPNMAFVSVLLVSVWQAAGYYMVIYTAGLQTIPRDIEEAAIIDGTSSAQRFFKVTFPLLMPSVTACMFLSTTNALKVFDVIFTLTGGGPGGTTTSIALDIYREAFVNNRYGYATAKSLVFFIITLMITGILVNFLKSREVES